MALQHDFHLNVTLRFALCLLSVIFRSVALFCAAEGYMSCPVNLTMCYLFCGPVRDVMANVKSGGGFSSYLSPIHGDAQRDSDGDCAGLIECRDSPRAIEDMIRR